jgi:putative hydrolase of the HAD superfamily
MWIVFCKANFWRFILTPSDWQKAHAVIFDVDGTLYHQGSVRLRTLRDLVIHSYRQNRELLAGQSTVTQFFQAGVDSELVRATVEYWMHTHPLRYLRAARFKGVDHFFKELKDRGTRIAILSDYPAEKKVQALGLHADIIVCSSDAGRLKPAPDGLRKIVEYLGVSPCECIMIGDRREKDGLCAEAMDMPFMLCQGAQFYTSLMEQVEDV